MDATELNQSMSIHLKECALDVALGLYDGGARLTSLSSPITSTPSGQNLSSAASLKDRLERVEMVRRRFDKIIEVMLFFF